MKKKAFIPIAALLGVLLLTLVAAMTPFGAEHNPVYAQTGSAVTTLNSLTVADEAGNNPISMLMPAFEADAGPAASGYVVYVANAVSSVTVTAEATHTAASVAIITDTDVDETVTTSPRDITLALADDDTKIDVNVTAQDGFTSETYTINVMKVEGASTTATLSSLSLTAGGDNLITEFVPDDGTDTANGADGVHDTAHPVQVSAATSSVVVNATTSHSGATVKTSSGTQTGDGVNDRFTLKDAGMGTEIKVEVTAQDKATTFAYMITVTRASSTASTDTNLSVLKLTTDEFGWRE